MIGVRFAVLGTGPVALTIAGKLDELDREVMLGSHRPDHPEAMEWVTQARDGRHGMFPDAA